MTSKASLLRFRVRGLLIWESAMELRLEQGCEPPGVPVLG